MLSPHWLFSILQWFFLARSPRRKSWTLRAKWLMVSAGWSAQPSTSTQCSEVRQTAMRPELHCHLVVMLGTSSLLNKGWHEQRIQCSTKADVLSCELLVTIVNDELTPAFTFSYHWRSGVERREVFSARCPVANTCQALPSGDLWLHKACVTLAAIHPTATKSSAGLPVSLRGRSEPEEKPRPPPGSNSFPVEILLTHNYVFNIQISCCQFDVFDVAVIGCRCCCYFLHTTKEKKNKYYFVRFVLPPRRYFEVFWQFATFR